MNIQAINKNLKIVNVAGKRFKCPGGVCEVGKGFAFKVDGYGFVAFESDRDPIKGLLPYIPKGGIKALESILSAGGFVSFDGMCFIKEA